MKKLLEIRTPSNKTGARMPGPQEEFCSTSSSDKVQFSDLTRLRIERNRTARHARCAAKRK